MDQLAIIRQMSRQVSRGSAGEYEADEQAGVMDQLESIRQMSMHVSRSSVDDYQADDQAGVTRVSWQVSGRCAGRCHTA